MKSDQASTFERRFGSEKLETNSRTPRNGIKTSKKEKEEQNKPLILSGLGIWVIIFITIVLWLVIAAILYLVAPTFVLEPDYSGVDTGKLALVSLIIALLFIILIWLFLSFSKDGCAKDCS
jgi:uncharacterized protein YqhQ